MKVSVDLGRWTALKVALLVGVGIGVAGAVGSAVAISPTVAPPIQWAGGWEYSRIHGSAGDYVIYTVPAGRNLLMTDITVSNYGASGTSFQLFTSLGPSCQLGGQPRVQNVAVPPGEAIHLSYQTGIGFGAGQVVCFANGETVSFTLRGFLFTPRPAS